MNNVLIFKPYPVKYIDDTDTESEYSDSTTIMNESICEDKIMDLENITHNKILFFPLMTILNFMFCIIMIILMFTTINNNASIFRYHIKNILLYLLDVL